MALTMQEIIPISLCISTQELMDAKRFQHNFCDNIILRDRDKVLEAKLTPIKRELNSQSYQSKYVEGHKAVIISNIDKIISVVSARYVNVDLNLVNAIIDNGKMIINKVLNADSFERIAELEPTFRSKITLPVYDLFIRNTKKTPMSLI